MKARSGRAGSPSNASAQGSLLEMEQPSSNTEPSLEALRAKAMAVHQRLCEEYGCPLRYFHALDPLSELVSALLSHRTRNRDSAVAFKNLRAQFPSWEAVRDAPTEAVQQAIVACTWPEQKAPRLQAVLREISLRIDSRTPPLNASSQASSPASATASDSARPLSLEFLRDWPIDEARGWLESLPGVGPKTSAAVISFSKLRGRALPVDSHHHRVATRLGLIPATTAVGPAHRLLEAQLPVDWDAQQVYDNHQVMMRHGQDVCTWRTPACTRCVVREHCDFWQRRESGKPAQPS